MAPHPEETSVDPAQPDRSLELAARIVVSCRRRLDWMLHLPEFEPLLPDGLSALELKGQRQGIGLRAAAEALPIEHKFTLLRWVLVHFRKLLPTVWALRLSNDWSVPLPPADNLDDHLSSTCWEEFRDGLAAALSREQRRYKQAQAALFHAHHGMVASVVARGVFSVARRDDAAQEGSLALLAAIDRIDDRSPNFAAYAQQWIARAVRNHLLREKLPVHAPVNVVSRALRGAPGDPALPDGMLEPSMELDHPAIQPQLADGGAPAPDGAAARADALALVREGMARLTPKQREVVELRYGLDGSGVQLTIQEIARRVGITHQQVSMREKRALEALASLLAPLAAELAPGG